MDSMECFCVPTPVAKAPLPFGPITLVSGLGRGPTPLAAFDAALLDAGVANYNLLCLSSVIPPGSTIVRGRWNTPAQDWGKRLYCVLSQAREDRPGHRVHAGAEIEMRELDEDVFRTAEELGIDISRPERGSDDDDRERLDHDLRATLASMQRQRGVALGDVHTEIASARCTDEPVCALVIAVYASAPW